LFSYLLARSLLYSCGSLLLRRRSVRLAHLPCSSFFTCSLLHLAVVGLLAPLFVQLCHFQVTRMPVRLARLPCNLDKNLFIDSSFLLLFCISAANFVRLLAVHLSAFVVCPAAVHSISLCRTACQLACEVSLCFLRFACPCLCFRLCSTARLLRDLAGLHVLARNPL